MRYLTDMTRKQADARNEAIYDAECAVLGCPTLKADRVTRYKFNTLNHPDRDECALLVGKDDERLLTGAEISALKTETAIAQEGWSLKAELLATLT